MDEPCSALDPIATRKIEELMAELKKRFTIVTVTHNLQQAVLVGKQDGSQPFFGIETDDCLVARERLAP